MQYRKIPYKLSPTRKRHIRERLKNVQNTMDILNSLNVPMRSLDIANMTHRYRNLSALERYTYFSTKHAARRPIRFVPHYTKVEAPTKVPFGYK